MSEMQEAGYILLMPGGDWNAGTTYHFLHLVNHNGASWVCKVLECTGQEPSDSNTEYWQRFGTAVDLSKYFKNTGGEVNGNVHVKSIEAVERAVIIENANRRISIEIAPDGSFGIWDSTNQKHIFQSQKKGNINFFIGMASENLPRAGGDIGDGSNGTPVRIVGRTDGTFIMFNNGEVDLARLGIDGAGKLVMLESDLTNREILHTGNKPTGTYTGNGDAIERTINTGGIGSACIINGGGWFAVVGTYGGVYVNGVQGTVHAIKHAELKFSNGILTIATTNPCVNASTEIYTYQVL